MPRRQQVRPLWGYPGRSRKKPASGACDGLVGVYRPRHVIAYDGEARQRFSMCFRAATP